MTSPATRTGLLDRRASGQPASVSDRATREPPDVVLVDDDTGLVAMVRFALESAGYSVATCDDGLDALATLVNLPQTGLPRLLALSVDLPGIDGHTLHEQLQRDRPGRFIVVFCSNRDSDAEQMRALGAGAVDYLVKPVSIPVLLAKIDGWLGVGRGAS